MSTMRACSTALEKRGPTGVQSVHEPCQCVWGGSTFGIFCLPRRRSMLSTTTTLIGLLELSANTLEMA